MIEVTREGGVGVVLSWRPLGLRPIERLAQKWRRSRRPGTYDGLVESPVDGNVCGSQNVVDEVCSRCQLSVEVLDPSEAHRMCPQPRGRTLRDSAFPTCPLATFSIHSSTFGFVLEPPGLSATEAVTRSLRGGGSFAIASEDIARR